MDHEKNLGIKNKKDAVLAFDGAGKIFDASPPVEQVTGYKPGELVGRSLREFISDPGEEQRALTAIKDSMTHETVAAEEFRFRHKDGKDFLAEMILVPGRAAAGPETGCQCLLRNVTRRREAEKHLAEAHAMQEQFTATVSHELRTPLSVIREALAMLRAGEAGPVSEDQKRFLDTAQTNVERLGKLINETLDLKALEQGRETLHFRENSVSELFDEVIRIKKTAADGKGLRMIPQVDRGVPRINFDREKILESFGILLDFAIQKSEKGDIVLQALIENNLVQISIRVPAAENPCEDLSRLFRPFEALDEAEKVKLGRTGVEFARVREIIEKHRGKIWAYFFAGKGFFFNMLLPVWERRVRQE